MIVLLVKTDGRLVVAVYMWGWEWEVGVRGVSVKEVKEPRAHPQKPNQTEVQI